KTLGETPQAPRFIQTVHRRGYRFIAKVQNSKFQVPRSHSAIRIPQSPINVVGRESELAQLQKWLKRALNGARQLVFVTGEAGIGKTTGGDGFVAHLSAKGNGWISRGQGIGQYWEGEAYLPRVEAR